MLFKSKQSQEIFETRKLCWDQFPGSCLNASLPVKQAGDTAAARPSRGAGVTPVITCRAPSPSHVHLPLPWRTYPGGGGAGGEAGREPLGSVGTRAIGDVSWLSAGFEVSVSTFVSGKKKSVSHWLVHPTENHLLSAERGPDLTSEMLPGPCPQCSPGSQPRPWAPHC